MSFVNGLPVNFTISERAKAELTTIRQIHLQRTGDPPAVLLVGWGVTTFDSGEISEGVAISYYGESERAAIEHGVERVSGVDLLFFITPENYGRFAGKLLDHRPDRGFHLVDPA